MQYDIVNKDLIWKLVSGEVHDKINIMIMSVADVEILDRVRTFCAKDISICIATKEALHEISKDWFFEQDAISHVDLTFIDDFDPEYIDEMIEEPSVKTIVVGQKQHGAFRASEYYREDDSYLMSKIKIVTKESKTSKNNHRPRVGPDVPTPVGPLSRKDLL